MAQETFLMAKAVLKRAKASSNPQSLDFLSSSALAACSRAAQDLQHLGITSEEKEIIEQSKTIEAVEDFIAQYIAEVDKKHHHDKTWKKVYAFSQFAGPVLEIFKQANFSPKCSIALGLVGMLLVQPLNNKSDIENRLKMEIGQLQDILSQVKFSKSNIHTLEIDVEIEGLCAAIIDFLMHALCYQKKWSLAKLLNGIIADFAKRFESFVVKIREHANKIEVLAQRGYTTTLLDSKEKLDKTAQMIQALQARIIAQEETFDIRVARLEDNIVECRKAVESNMPSVFLYSGIIEETEREANCNLVATRFTAIQYVQSLAAILLPNPPSVERQILFLRQQETLLATRERWDSNISEIQAPGWLTRSPRPILWIGGRQNKRGVSWVSSFSLDLVEALEMERAVQVIVTLCDGGQEDAVQGPLGVFKWMVLQLLKSYPEVVLRPQNLEKLSLQRFQAVGQSPEAMYKVLADILKMVDAQCQTEGKELFLLIDRVDIVLTKMNQRDKQRFLKALWQLIEEYKTLRIVVTSQLLTAEMEIEKGMKEGLMEICVDTTKPLPMHSSQYKGNIM